VLTVVALFYYLVVAKRMYVDPPARPGRVTLAPTLAIALALCAAGIVAIGVYPKPVVTAALRVAGQLF
jgi:NADH-quinone oxidoreductase subunit N